VALTAGAVGCRRGRDGRPRRRRRTGSGRPRAGGAGAPARSTSRRRSATAGSPGSAWAWTAPRLTGTSFLNRPAPRSSPSARPPRNPIRASEVPVPIARAESGVGGRRTETSTVVHRAGDVHRAFEAAPRASAVSSGSRSAVASVPKSVEQTLLVRKIAYQTPVSYGCTSAGRAK
jgi:hypothetical protein